MGKKTIVLLVAASLQGWGHDISPQERPPFEQTILTKAAEKRIFSSDDVQRVRNIEAFLERKPKGKVNLIKNMSEVKYQGRRGSCSNFATMGLLEHFLNKKENFSEQCLAYFSSSTDSGTITEKLAFIRSQGMYQENDCPYINPEELDNWFTADDAEQKVLRLQARNTIPSLKGAKKITPVFQAIERHVDDLSDVEFIRYIQYQLDRSTPVTAAVISIGEDWDNDGGMIEKIPSPEQIKEECKDKERTSALSFSTMSFKKCDSHAVVLTGYDDTKKLIYFKNSWDKTWGLNEDMNLAAGRIEKTGYGAFSYAYLTKFRINTLITLSR